MLTLVALGLTLALGEPNARAIRVESHSKQFVILATPDREFSRGTSRPNHIRLAPPLLAVSCDRIRQALFAELDLAKKWPGFPARQDGVGTIFLVLSTRPGDGILISSVPSRTGWSYWVDLPLEVESSQIVSAVVRALLLGLANTSNQSQIIDLPEWLTRGLIAHLQATTLQGFVLQTDHPVNRESIKTDSAAQAREHLHDRPGLTFDELSWPDQLPPALAVVYNDCAHLFVAELLKLDGGGAVLRDMIGLLSKYKNWQFAFLRAYQRHFSQLVDVEKWWALKLAKFSERGPIQSWAEAESGNRLDAALRVPVKVFGGTRALPARGEVSVQEIVKDWDYSRQKICLQAAERQLTLMRPHVAREMLALLDGYRSAIEIYLKEMDGLGTAPLRRGQPAANPKVLKESFIRQLTLLDEERASLRRKLVSK